MSPIPLLVTREPKSPVSIFSFKDHFDQELDTVTSINNEDIDQVCQDATIGFQNWSLLDIQERVTFLQEFKKNFLELKQKLREECIKVGMPGWFADFNHKLAADLIDYNIHNMVTYDEGCIPTSNGGKDQLSLVFREPVGPVFSVSSWNGPVILTMRSILSPLLAGCSVLVKSSEQSPNISYIICKAFLDTKPPLGTLQMVHSDPKDVAEFVRLVIANNNIRMINFTGSTFVGSKIASLCGQSVKPYLLELGGKNTVIVQPDVLDLGAAMKTALTSAWSHKGQVCMCTDRLYLHEDIYDEGCKLLLEFAKEHAHTDDQKINQRNLVLSTKIKNLVKDAISKGAKILYEAGHDIDHENFVDPMILTDVDESLELSKTESFGPLLTVIRYSNVDTLVEHLNQEEFGLKTAVWSGNHFELLKILRKIQSGGVHINGSTISDEPWLPHGGVKTSGIGRFNGRWGIQSFSYIKTITVDK